jgi:hypothetical protein
MPLRQPARDHDVAGLARERGLRSSTRPSACGPTRSRPHRRRRPRRPRGRRGPRTPLAVPIPCPRRIGFVVADPRERHPRRAPPVRKPGPGQRHRMAEPEALTQQIAGRYARTRTVTPTDRPPPRLDTDRDAIGFAGERPDGRRRPHGPHGARHRVRRGARPHLLAGHISSLGTSRLVAGYVSSLGTSSTQSPDSQAGSAREPRPPPGERRRRSAPRLPDRNSGRPLRASAPTGPRRP